MHVSLAAIQATLTGGYLLGLVILSYGMLVDRVRPTTGSVFSVVLVGLFAYAEIELRAIPHLLHQLHL